MLDVQSAAVRTLRMSALKVPNRPTDAAGRQHAEALDVKRELLQVQHSRSIPPHGFHAFGVFREAVNAVLLHTRRHSHHVSPVCYWSNTYLLMCVTDAEAS